MSLATPPSNLRENLRAMPAQAWVLFAGSFVNRLGTFVLPFITLYLTSRRYGAPEAGVAIAAYGLGGLASQAAGGLLADRFGRRNPIVLSMLSAGLLTLMLWGATSLAVIYPLMLALGFLGEMYRPAAGALIADLVPPERRVTAFTLYRLAVNLGWAGGLALGGFLAERNFAFLFVGDALTSVAFGVLAYFALPHGTRTTRQEEADLPTARRSILADRGFLLFLGSTLLGGAVYSQNVSTLPLHVVGSGFGPSAYGLLQAMNGMLVVAFELPVIAWTQRRDRLRMVALGHLLIGLAFASLVVARTFPALAAMVVVWTLGEMIESPVASAVAADRAPGHARGRYQSAFGAMFGVAWIVGPVLGTSAYALRPALLWIGCGVVGIASAALALAAGRHAPPSTV